MSNYELIDHTADTGIKVWGKSPAELFRNAAMALTDIIVEGSVASTVSENISIKSEDYENLMVDWLEEVLYLFDTKKFLASNITVKRMDSTNIEAQLQGSTFDSAHQTIKKEVKAITYHNLKVWKEEDKWLATIIFDI